MAVLYYITDRSAFPGNQATRRNRLLEKIAEATRSGVDYIQLREKDLSTRELERLAIQVVRIVDETTGQATDHRPPATALLINSRTDVAIATGVAGVHLPANDISPADVRKIWKCGRSVLCGAGSPFDKVRACPELAEGAGSAGELSPRDPTITVSCHSPEDVAQAAANGADFAVFAPVFEKKDAPGCWPAGLAKLHEACRAKIPVLALGGITLENARSCLEAGAAGIAAIRLFQENDIAIVARALRR